MAPRCFGGAVFDELGSGIKEIELLSGPERTRPKGACS
jgi:hypothetical protein